MARITAAFGASHSVMLAATLDDWQHNFRQSDLRMPFFDREGRPCTYAQLLAQAPADAAEQITAARIAERYAQVQAALAHLKQAIAEAQLDVLVIVGDDQYELFQDTHMPAVGIYYGENIRNADRAHAERSLKAPELWYRTAQMRRFEDVAPRTYACHKPLALHLIEQLVQREFDISAISGLPEGAHEGHAYSFIHRWFLQDVALPIIPVFVNTYNPPNPPLPRRCVSLGAAMRQSIEAFPEDLRVGLLASGGMSHFVVDEELDRGLLQALADKDMAHLAALDPRRLKAGSSEIRNWIIVASAVQHLDLRWSSYTPAYRTPALSGTGLGFAHWY